jgi:hypothetical protein
VSQMAALEGAGVSIAVLKMGPCGMLPVHEHPRAGNVVTGITGNVTSWMIGDNGSRVVTVNIFPFIVTYFPPGTVHVMQNNGTSPPPPFLALSHPPPNPLEHRTTPHHTIPSSLTHTPSHPTDLPHHQGCKEALLISSLSSDDSGTNNVLHSFSQMPDPIIRASFGNNDFDVRAYKAKVPEVGTGVIRGSAECLKRCGIKP